MNVPTKITVVRIALVGALLLCFFILACIPDLTVPCLGDSGINAAYLAFTIVFLLAALTDWLDGHLARKLHLITDLGKFLDPIADKALVNSALILLLVKPAFAPAQLPQDPLAQTFLTFGAILMIVRDLIVDALRFIAVKKGAVIAANIFGKAKTVLQMVAIPLLLLNDWPFSYIYRDIPAWPEVLHFSYLVFYAATLMSLTSGVIYIIRNRQVLAEEGK